MRGFRRRSRPPLSPGRRAGGLPVGIGSSGLYRIAGCGPEAARLALRKGDIVRCVTTTGGGWGRPEDRLEDQIAEDLRNDFLTAEQAAGYKA